MTQNTVTKTSATNYEYKEDFNYTHDNPYHDRLADFEHFVMRDKECENYKNHWREKVFQNDFPLAVEVGTGYGHFMLDFTEKFPNENFIGLDHRFKRSFNLAKKLSKLEHQNFRYLRARGERLGFMFGKEEVDKIFYFFPDPWPKTRHHKKRLFQAPFLKSCHEILKKDGTLFIKTDHDDYFEWMLTEVQKLDDFKITFETKDMYQDAPEHFLASFQTKFEKIFLAKGIKIKAMTLQKADS